MCICCLFSLIRNKNEIFYNDIIFMRYYIMARIRMYVLIYFRNTTQKTIDALSRYSIRLVLISIIIKKSRYIFRKVNHLSYRD